MFDIQELDAQYKTIMIFELEKRPIGELIRDEYFNNRVSYPAKVAKPRLQTPHTAARALEYAEQLARFEKSKEHTAKLLSEYRAGERLIMLIFKFACFHDLGWPVDCEACHKAFAYAEEQGHSAGISEVYGHLVDLDSIIKCIPKTLRQTFESTLEK